MNNVEEVLEKLAAKQFDALVGVSESVWLDAKESPYLLDVLKQKLELAKDVSLDTGANWSDAFALVPSLEALPSLPRR